MNVQPSGGLGRTAFLAWAPRQRARYELVNGRPVMMTGGSRGHAIITRRLAQTLEAHLDGSRWAVLTSDFGVGIGEDIIRYPDVVVDVAGASPDDLTAAAPALIAEVVSPSSANLDLGEKAREYLSLPSLSAYVVLAQHEMKAWIWLRGRSGFPPEPAIVQGADGRIEIADLGMTMSLAEIYPSSWPSA